MDLYMFDEVLFGDLLLIPDELDVDISIVPCGAHIYVPVNFF